MDTVISIQIFNAYRVNTKPFVIITKYIAVIIK